MNSNEKQALRRCGHSINSELDDSVSSASFRLTLVCVMQYDPEQDEPPIQHNIVSIHKEGIWRRASSLGRVLNTIGLRGLQRICVR